MENDNEKSNEIEVLEIENNEEESDEKIEELKIEDKPVEEPVQNNNEEKQKPFPIFLLILAIIQAVAIYYVYNNPHTCDPRHPNISTYHGEYIEEGDYNE